MLKLIESHKTSDMSLQDGTVEANPKTLLWSNVPLCVGHTTKNIEVKIGTLRL